MSAHDLLTTRDCTAWSCTASATGDDGLCDEHREAGVLGSCEKNGCQQHAVERVKGGRWTRAYCSAHLAEFREAKSRGGRRRTLAAVPSPAADPEKTGPVEAAHSGRAQERAGGGRSKREPTRTAAVSVDGTSLVEAAQRVSDLTSRRRAMLAELDALEVELRDALGACREALRACEVEVAA